MFTYRVSVLAVFILPASAWVCGDIHNASSHKEYESGYMCCNGIVMPSDYSGKEVGCCGNSSQLFYTMICECKDDNIRPKTQDSSVDSCLVKVEHVANKRDTQQTSIPPLQMKKRLTKSVCWKRFGLSYCEHAKTCYYTEQQICCEDGIHIGKKVCPSIKSNRKIGTANKDNKRNVTKHQIRELLFKIKDTMRLL